MNISDLSYVEVLSQDAAAASIKGGYGYYSRKKDVDFYKDIDTNVSTYIEFNTDFYFDKDFYADVDVYSNANVEGNIASATFEIEAVGKNTLAEQDVSVLAVEGQFSSIAGNYLAAVSY